MLWTLLEPIHAVTYFAPESRAAAEEVGLRGFWRGYFAFRSAPLGLAPAVVTTTAYAGFAPRMVERALPSVWSLASPEKALRARLTGATGALGRLLPAVGDAPAVLREVVAAAPTSGRVLGAANAALPWPASPLGDLWQAATTLRELRGDGHVLAQVAHGLDGLATMVLRSGHDLSRGVLQANRGWTDEEWTAAADGLAARGLLDGAGRATADGVALLDRVEALTDELADEPWRAVRGAAERYADLGGRLAAAARTVLPDVNPIGLPRA